MWYTLITVREEPTGMKGETKMKVYVVWYKNDLGTGLWNIYREEERAAEAVRMIKEDGYGTEAWYNEEEVR